MKIHVTALLLFISAAGWAQKPPKRHSTAVEVMGNGIVLSLNYEHLLRQTPGLAWHLGIGLGGNGPVIPFGLRYLIPLGGERSFIETGAGITLAERSVWKESDDNVMSNPYQPALVPSLGYRRHTTGNLMWKLIYSPLFTKERTEWMFFGAALGWRF